LLAFRLLRAQLCIQNLHLQSNLPSSEPIKDLFRQRMRRNMSSTDVVANGHSHDFEYTSTYNQDHVLRPRPRKPLHAQVSQLSAASSTDGDSQHLNLPGENGAGSATTR
jgi:hypothetical protein